MKVRGYPIVNRHSAAGSGERQFAGASGESESANGHESLKTNGVEQLPGAPSMPIPADHPLALRFRANGRRIADLQSWKQAIQVGSAEIAVA